MTIARKDHTCDLCNTTIPRGSDYTHWRMTPWTSGDPLSGFYSYRVHSEPCQRALEVTESESDGTYYMPCWQDFQRDYLTVADRAVLGLAKEGQR